jgi:hypothetical protein
MALAVVEKAVGARDMEDHWISKLESLKNKRRTQGEPGKDLMDRTKQIKANLVKWNMLKE